MHQEEVGKTQHPLERARERRGNWRGREGFRQGCSESCLCPQQHSARGASQVHTPAGHEPEHLSDPSLPDVSPPQYPSKLPHPGHREEDWGGGTERGPGDPGPPNFTPGSPRPWAGVFLQS